jgi:hypothetical protein
MQVDKIGKTGYNFLGKQKPLILAEQGLIYGG